MNSKKQAAGVGNLIADAKAKGAEDAKSTKPTKDTKPTKVKMHIVNHPLTAERRRGLRHLATDLDTTTRAILNALIDMVITDDAIAEQVAIRTADGALDDRRKG